MGTKQGRYCGRQLKFLLYKKLKYLSPNKTETGKGGTPVMAAAAAQCVPLRGSPLAPASPETAKVPASTPTSSAASASPPLRAAVAPSSGRRSGAPLRRRRARHRRISACLWRWKGEGLKNPAFLVLGLLIPLVFIPKGVSFLLLEDSRC